jgi:hypothetical protein
VQHPPTFSHAIRLGNLGRCEKLSISLTVGKEPYRKFGIHVNEQPLTSPEDCKMVQACQKKYWDRLTKVLSAVTMTLRTHAHRVP